METPMNKPFNVGDKVKAIGGTRIFVVGEVSVSRYGWFWNAQEAIGAQSSRRMCEYELVEVN